MAAPLTALAAQGAAGPQTNTQVAQAQQVRPDCPNNGQQLRDGSGRTREGSLHQNRGAGLRDGSGRAGNRGAGPKEVEHATVAQYRAKMRSFTCRVLTGTLLSLLIVFRPSLSRNGGRTGRGF